MSVNHKKPAYMGGEPAFDAKEVKSLWPVSGREEKDALERVVTSGKWCRITDEDWRTGESGLFESEFARYLGVSHFMGVANGTLAIELALLALGTKPGDEVLVQASTFFGSVTPIVRIGAVPVFVDLEPQHYCIDPDNLAARITPRTRGVIVVHLSGISADLDRIKAICEKHSLFLIEDCAQSVGSEWRERRLGVFGDVSCFSFQQGKTLQCGEGGGVATNSAELAGKLYAFHQGFDMPGSPPQQKHEVASNVRISPWQSAILRCQLKRLDEQIAKRSANQELLSGLLEESDALAPLPLPSQQTRWSLFSRPFKYSPDKIGGLPKDIFIEALSAEGIPAFDGHIDPVYRRPIFVDNRINYVNAGCPVSERINQEEYVCIMQPFFLGPQEWMKKAVEVMRNIQTSAPKLQVQAGDGG